MHRIVGGDACGCGQRWMQVAPQPLLHACIRDDAAAAPLEVLRIKQLNYWPACITMFSGTLRHLVLPKVTRLGAWELPAVVVALTLLQVPTGLPPLLQPSLLGRANVDLQWPRLHHARLLALHAAKSHFALPEIDFGSGSVL